MISRVNYESVFFRFVKFPQAPSIEPATTKQDPAMFGLLKFSGSIKSGRNSEKSAAMKKTTTGEKDNTTPILEASTCFNELA